MSAATWVWMKSGDHRDEASNMVAKFVAEVGQAAALDDVSIRLATTPSGGRITLLVADNNWWREQMEVHPAGWRGALLEDMARRLGI